MPTSDPRAFGRSGVRSPLRKGRKVRPPAPGSVKSRAASMSAKLCPIRATVAVTSFVSFIVQTRGNQPPDEEQNGATLPVGSLGALSLNEYTVDEVPRLNVTLPSRTFPVPIAPIMLSPPPEETTVVDGNF